MSQHEHLAVFLDTNVYLHYQSFEQIDWRRLLGARRVTICVPAVVIGELDKHKDEHRIPRIRRRAATVSAKLFEYSETPESEVRPAVTLRFLLFDPQVNFVDFHLNTSRQDDQLLAAVLRLREDRDDACPVVVTNDLNLLMKARQLGINTYRPPDDLKLPEEPDAEEQKIKELEHELNRVKKTAAPDLGICFSPGGADHAAFQLAYPKAVWGLVLGLEFFQLRQRYPKATPSDKVISFAECGRLKEAAGELQNAERLAETLETFGEMMRQVHPLEVERYNQELDGYFRAYEQYRKDSIEYENRWARTLRLEVQLVNEGTCPAEDVDVTLDFPEEVTLLAEGNFSPPPVAPQPPSPPQALGAQVVHIIASGLSRSVKLLKPAPVQQLLPSSLSAQPVRNPEVLISAGGRRAEFKVDRLKHTLRTRGVTLYALFSSFEAAGSFTIPYRAVAANVPQPVTGCLHVKVEKCSPPAAARSRVRRNPRS